MPRTSVNSRTFSLVGALVGFSLNRVGWVRRSSLIGPAGDRLAVWPLVPRQDRSVYRFVA